MAIWVANQKNVTLFYWGEMGNEASKRNAEWWMTPILVLSYIKFSSSSQTYRKEIRTKQPEGSNVFNAVLLLVRRDRIQLVTTNLWPPELPFLAGTTMNTTVWMCHFFTGNLVLPGRHWRKRNLCDWRKSSMQVTKAREMGLNMLKTFGATASSMLLFCVQLTR